MNRGYSLMIDRSTSRFTT